MLQWLVTVFYHRVETVRPSSYIGLEIVTNDDIIFAKATLACKNIKRASVTAEMKYKSIGGKYVYKNLLQT